MKEYKLILSFSAFQRHFFCLSEGDLVAVRIPLKPEEAGLVVDLIERGVQAFPPFLSQLLSRSKVLQSQVLKNFMPPFTFSIRNKTSLLHAMAELLKTGYKKFITKADDANCGLGIKCWSSLEDVFNFAGTEALPYPFVLQPFFEEWKDYRVIILGDLYVEAYERQNPFNFRQNLFFGGKAIPHELTEQELEFCQKVMERGKFPYAHIDMVYIDGKGPYLSEINLKGGLKGAKILPEEYEKLLKDLTHTFICLWKENKKVKILS